MNFTTMKTISTLRVSETRREEEHNKFRENDLTSSIGFFNFNIVCLQASSPFTSKHGFRDNNKRENRENVLTVFYFFEGFWFCSLVSLLLCCFVEVQ